MFNIDIPRYFCLDLIETKPIFQTQSKTGTPTKQRSKSVTLPGRLKLTDKEREFEKRMAEFTFQLELEKDLSSREVAQIFNNYGDVTVVKSAPSTYWIDFESFDSHEVATQCPSAAASASLSQGAALGRVIQHICKENQGLVRKIREYTNAVRFP